MKVNNVIYFMLIMCELFVSCQSPKKEINPLELCTEFYELNIGLEFNRLLDVQIGLRGYSEYNESTRKNDYIPVVIGINDSISNENIKLSAFRRNADLKEQKLFYARCDSSSIAYLKNKYKLNSSDDIFKFYTKEVRSIYSNYYQIKVPDELSYSNIKLVGSNNYIEFILYKDEEKRIKYSCYFVKDSIPSNDRLKNYFNELPKFDKHWYYKINPLTSH